MNQIFEHYETGFWNCFQEGPRRPFVAAHFHGNTSHLSTEIHDNYKGIVTTLLFLTLLSPVLFRTQNFHIIYIAPRAAYFDYI